MQGTLQVCVLAFLVCCVSYGFSFPLSREGEAIQLNGRRIDRSSHQNHARTLLTEGNESMYSEEPAQAQLVYVYNLGTELNTDLLNEVPKDWARAYEAETQVFSMLAEENLMRTFEPEKATLFFVPFLSARFTLNHFSKEADKEPIMNSSVVATSAAWQKLLRKIRNDFPFFNSSNGRDHFSVLAHEQGRCSALTFCNPAEYGEMFFFQLNGDRFVRSTHATTGRYLQALAYNFNTSTQIEIPDIPCYMAGRDIVIPPVPAREYIAPPQEKRDIIALLPFNSTGGREVAVPRFSHPNMHKELLEMYEGLEGWVFGLKEDVAEDWERALFCITPPGYAQYTAHLARAVMAGCIPVTFFRFNDQPWGDVLDYGKFSINVDPDDMRSLQTQLAGLSADRKRLHHMHLALRRVQGFFSWSRDEPHGARAQVLHALHQKATGLLRSSASRSHECPHCLGIEGAALPLEPVGPLDEADSKAKLCSGSISRPFIAGTYIQINQEDKKKSLFTVLTVFEAEVRHFAPADAPSGSSPHQVRLLAALEDDSSLKSSQDGGSSAVMSQLDLKLRCRFMPPQSNGIGPSHEWPAVTARVERISESYLVITCPIPTTDSGTPLPKSILHGRHFRLLLEGDAGGQSQVLMEPLPLCRANNEKAVPEATVNSENGALGPPRITVCLSPYSNMQLLSGAKISSDTRLLEWIDFHLATGVDLIYVYDRFGSSKMSLLWPYIQRGQVRHVAFPHWSEVFYRKERYGGNDQQAELFPAAYDVHIAAEHCAMQGRRNGDTWQLYLSFDKFIGLHSEDGLSSLKAELAKAEQDGAAKEGKAVQALVLEQYSAFSEKELSTSDNFLDIPWETCSPAGLADGSKPSLQLAMKVEHYISRVEMATSSPSVMDRSEVSPDTLRVIKFHEAGVTDASKICGESEKKRIEDLASLKKEVEACKQKACKDDLPSICQKFCKLDPH